MSGALLADYLDLPVEVHKSDYVVSLAESLGRAERTLRDYVVTPQLAEVLAEALSLVASSIESGTSKGAYLHSSFGGGKSHFMAVLGLTLEGEPAVRAKDGLAEVVAKFEPRLGGRKALVVPLNMIGAESMEAAVLGGYVEHVRALHPGVRLPPVFVADGLLADAEALRGRMGDEAFFASLGGGTGGDRWGKLSGAWDAAGFERAVAAPPGDSERDRLVSALVSTYYTHLLTTARSQGEGYVSFDEGLGAISRHARELGYDAVVVFLDELILWLASRMADQVFVNREGPKIGKLVESGTTERPAPIVSFVARQRDLRELVGEHVPGADQLNFSTILSWWEGRFDTITLEDRNLPAIVEQRLLRPKSAIAAEAVDQAFAATTGQAGERVVDTLCTSTADRATFRRVYPFSPALVSALVDLSSVLQRERTALRVLAQLLAEGRTTLRLGDLVPMGDLYDALAGGDEPFSAEMKERWAKAQQLYRTGFRPMLLAEHGLTEDDLAGLAAGHAFHSEDRIVKTLLLAALVPGSDTFRDLTVSRLAALNHGTIRTPIPGQERSVVLSRLQRWSGTIGELKLGDDPTDPTVAVQLVGIDTDAILAKAAYIDSAGERRRKIKDLLFEAVGIVADANGTRRTVVWKGTPRTVDVVFGNLRDKADLPDSVLAADRGVPKVVLDYPFDEHGQRPSDDLARVEEYRSANQPTATLCWIPLFLTDRSLDDLGKLVTLDHVLSGDNFDRYANHLPLNDRPTARSLLENRRTMLRTRVHGVLRQAYRVEEPAEANVVVSLPADQQFTSLDSTFVPRRPSAATMQDGFDKLVGQLLTVQYPGHPDFGEEVRTAELRQVLAEVERAATERVTRLDVAGTPLRRTMRRIANPLRLGEMREAHYLPGTEWTEHFDRLVHAEAPPVLTVSQLRAWTDVPVPRGLTREVQDLVILAYAASTDRVLLAGGAPVKGDVGRLQDTWELHTQALPTAAQWTVAVQRAGEVFGLTASPVVTAAGAAKLVAEVKAKVNEARAAVAEYDAELRARLAARGLGEDVDRARTAAAARSLVEDIRSADEGGVVPVLAAAAIPTTGPALGASISRAADLARVLRAGGTNWELLDTACSLGEPLAAQAAALRAKVDAALAADDFVIRLRDALATAVAQATELVGKAVQPPVPSPEPGLRVVAEERRLGLGRDDALAAVEGLKVTIEQSSAAARIDVAWTVREPDGDA